MQHFIKVRQMHLINPAHSKSVQANTILVTGIPPSYLSESALSQLYSHLPGGIAKVWINRYVLLLFGCIFSLVPVRSGLPLSHSVAVMFILFLLSYIRYLTPVLLSDLKELPSIYNRRLAACSKLESAEISLQSTAAKLRREALKKADGAGEPLHSADPERNATLAERLVPRNKWPTHRLPVGFMPFSLPFIGEKVDTIDWCRKEIVATTGLLMKGRRTVADESLLLAEDVNGDGKIDRKDLNKQNYPPLNSAFITFNQQIAAHLAVNVLTHHEPYCMTDRYLEVSPPDVIWRNLGLNPYEKRIRMVISYAITLTLIIFWSIPVSFVGIISNIQGLCQREAWLAWLCALPQFVVGIIQGILPALLLSILMMLLPVILRFLGRFEGIPTRTGLELSLMTRYFIFQVIVSVSSLAKVGQCYSRCPSTRS